MKRVFTMPNGIRVVIAPYSRAIFSGLSVAFQAGSVYEPPDARGISHFLEHLIAHCNVEFPSFQARGEAIDLLTTEFDAETGQRVMKFTFETDTRNFEKCVKLAHTLITKPQLGKTVIRRELSRIINEKARSADDAETLGIDFIDETMNRGKSGRPSILGELRALSELPPDAFRKFYRTTMVGSRMAVVATGSIDEARAKEIITSIFSTIPEGHPAPDITPALHRRRVHVIPRDTESVYVNIAFPSPFGFAHRNRIVLSLLKNHLVDRESSLLNVRLIGDLGHVYALGGSVWHANGHGYMLISFSVQPEHLTQIFQAVLDEFVLLHNGGISHHDLWMAQRYLKRKARDYRMMPTTEAVFFAEQVLATGDIVPSATFIREVNSFGIRQVRALAKRIIRPDRAHVALVGPLEPATTRRVYAQLHEAQKSCN